jgi:D-glycero-alpha-D-manno-heptose-7-phosphate kinase
VGGFNMIEFLKDGGGVRVEPLITPPRTLERLHRSLMLFYTARQRSAADVLSGQRNAINDGSAVDALAQMRDLAFELRDALGRGEAEALGPILSRNWELKRTLTAGVSDAEIDGWYDTAMGAGATGGKLLGAGAGGFLLLVVPEDRQAHVRGALPDLREVPFHFSARGAQVEFLDPTRY